MVMNVRKPPLDNVRECVARSHASDQDAMNDCCSTAITPPSEGPLNNNHRCFWDGAGKMYERSVDKATAFLTGGLEAVAGKPIREAQGVAGVADGTPLRIRYNVLHHKEIGEALQGQMRRAGIDLAVEVVPGPVQLDRVRKRDFELMYERQRSPDPRSSIRSGIRNGTSPVVGPGPALRTLLSIPRSTSCVHCPHSKIGARRPSRRRKSSWKTP